MRPVTTALTLSGLLALYLGLGIITGDKKPQVDFTAKKNSGFNIVYTSYQSQYFDRRFSIRGYTEALKMVNLMAEVEGRVIATPVEKGFRVAKGDVICQLRTNDRLARLTEAKAMLQQRNLEYKASTSLTNQGHRSATQQAAAKAKLDAAGANVEKREQDLANTKIKAPFAGLINDRPAEIGAFLQKGSECATIILEDPYLVVGEVSETFVSALKVGNSATIEINGIGMLEGKVRFIAGIANSQTRAFRIEVEIPNKNNSLRDGLTSTIQLSLGQLMAHFLPSSTLVLNTDGVLGVRSVDNNSIVHFHPIEIIDDDLRGIWVTGLPDLVKVITAGQNFVSEGEEVHIAKEQS